MGKSCKMQMLKMQQNATHITHITHKNKSPLWHEQHTDKPRMLLTSVAWWFIGGLECMQTLLHAHEARMGLTKVLHKLKSREYSLCF